MYQPAHFVSKELAQAKRLMAAYPLALLLGPDAQGQSFGTHVPLTVIEGEDLVIEGHMARANPHWAWLAALHEKGLEVHAVFNGPGAYVSPSHYDSALNVPTWNYAAVHLYGRLELVQEPEAKDALLKRLIAQHEPGYAAQWRALPADFQQKLLGAIVGFRLHVQRWEGKFKLSQNRSAAERARIQTALASGTPSEQDVAAWMAHLGI
ncbi:FMN-binding negative transcriptional regulator [Paucibacter sp. Y2R2-4]|uniref:FMN-binding negative transcriptional regulator n=1 Tax=Paucibacter sp. Y2R2-4 TaxID=2893553 RepID=UPI0021E37818|nr:FMN-binding negative transcriptional regulator [Paucibacter sp. Y2R2-4]MCV2350389.1 FMN-binding negative transcriptional regulator [Paucibacter sp. Y2R2-4]